MALRIIISADAKGQNGFSFESMADAKKFLWSKHEIDFAELVFRQCSIETSIMAEAESKWLKKVFV